ncbi:FAD/NAD-P-binding domain-containing protein [Peniophora sp. CONT]|nr:FAD/NAD-P-binding domain-containing protein [Peniophora sp. CONT]
MPSSAEPSYNSTVPTVPLRTSILVVGGGPAGSYAATLLAREGFDVTLLERDQFPRYHIGESLLPSIPRYLSFIEAEEIIKAKGFKIKPGAAVKLNQYSREGYTDFATLDSESSIVTWNVVRSEFDDALLKYAAKSGVRVFEDTKVTSIRFDDPECTMRPTACDWKTKTGTEGTLQFSWLIDASGRAGIMSTQYLHNRKYNASLKNVACWGYWKGGAMYAPGTEREDAPWFEALTDESGWAWYIPLHNGTTSVGVVLSEAASNRKKSDIRALKGDVTLTEHYHNQLSFVPGISKLLEHATLVSTVKSASDYSYSASSSAGPGYRMVGDAAAFIDPFFSSGVHLAFTSALSAACSIAASIRGHCSEDQAITFHNLKTGTAYTRFLVVVLGAYRQIQSQDVPVLQDVDEDNFDRAFYLLRPVLRGESDVSGGSLTEDELIQAMRFCSAVVLAPTTPSMHADVAKRLPDTLTDVDGPVMLSEDIKRVVGEDDDEAFHVLREINARKPIHQMYDVGNHFVQEAFCGLVPRIERGELGLVTSG